MFFFDTDYTRSTVLTIGTRLAMTGSISSLCLGLFRDS